MTLKRWDPLPESKWEEESTLVAVVDAPLVVAKVQEGSGVLRQWVSSMKRALGMRGKQQLFLVIRGLTKYYRKNSALANSEFRAMARAQLEGTVTGRSDGGAQAGRVSKEEVEKQLVRLQVAEGCYLIEGELAITMCYYNVAHVTVETTEDMENWVWNLTADIAIRPVSHLLKCRVKLMAISTSSCFANGHLGHANHFVGLCPARTSSSALQSRPKNLRTRKSLSS